jgi:oligopeptide/dipeptide ABC transporter ATP-binding protein
MTNPERNLLEVENLTVTFAMRKGVTRKARVHAVTDVSFHLARGECLGLVGESGSGKSTTGRAVLRLVDIDRGSVRFDGLELTGLRQRQLRPHRRRMQIVFQDPYSSLDPSMVVRESIAEPLTVHTTLSRKARSERVADLLETVGLRVDHAERYPYEFSGGQRQRIAIARALALEPELLVLDEPVSALDASTQSQVVNLLDDLGSRMELSFLFIAHDLSVVRHVSDRVAVMYLGHIVDQGPTERIYNEPGHPYTQALLSAVPIPHPATQRSRRRIVLCGDLPDPTHPPTGCIFHTRCPYVMPICEEERPDHTPMSGGGSAACHLHTSGPALGGETLVHLAPTAIASQPPSGEDALQGRS